MIKGFSKASIAANVARLMREGKRIEQSVAEAHSIARTAYRAKHPGAKLPAWVYPGKGAKNTSAGITRNPSPRSDTEAAARLAKAFHGREPQFEDAYKKPKIPNAMANIGKVFAIEYLAERDGKTYRFRHAFKQQSRPQLAVAPDGKFVTMIGGSWRFGEDGFEDL